MRTTMMTLAACSLVLCAPAGAQRQAKGGTPPQVQRLLGCAAITAADQRLACYDREAAGLGQAIAKRDVVMIDRQTTAAAKRSLFGFSVPSFGGLFGGAEDEVQEIEQSVTGIGRNPEGGYSVRLADGSTWTQTDDVTMALPPRRGDKVKIRRRTLGAFSMSVNGQPGVRVRRIG